MMVEEKKSSLSILTAGLLKENPVLVLLLGTCPTLAATTMTETGIGMGLAATFVLVCSNTFISLLKDFIPARVRIPCYIVLIAGFTTVMQLGIKAYFPVLDDSLGLYLPLIAVNCIILGRAEMFASKNTVGHSFLDGLGMGLGFTLALVILGSIREILGSGEWFGNPVFAGKIEPMIIFLLAPGGFFVYGCIIAAVNFVTNGKAIKKKSMGCGDCPSASVCGASGPEQCTMSAAGKEGGGA